MMKKPSPRVLQSFCLEGSRVEPLGTGLINETWLVETPQSERLVLQRVNPVFPAEVNEDIDLVTRHLGSKGLTTPRVLPTRKGALCEEHHGVWRVTTYIHGISRDAVERDEQAGEAGALLARFHNTLSDLDHDFKNARLGVHDTKQHLAALKEALDHHRHHEQFDKVKTLADDVLAFAAELPELPDVTERIVHGDPKISNVIFDESTDEAICLVDLDTLTRMPVFLELGDAMRSWCNPSTEDDAGSTFSLPTFRAAAAGYARGAPGFLEETEWRAISDATLTITVELAARFCTDALAEGYFGWDRRRYRRASEHNQARTTSQLAVARSIVGQQESMKDAVAAAFGA